jgi:hypothetical protein
MLCYGNQDTKERPRPHGGSSDALARLDAQLLDGTGLRPLDVAVRMHPCAAYRLASKKSIKSARSTAGSMTEEATSMDRKTAASKLDTLSNIATDLGVGKRALDALVIRLREEGVELRYQKRDDGPPLYDVEAVRRAVLPHVPALQEHLRVALARQAEEQAASAQRKARRAAGHEARTKAKAAREGPRGEQRQHFELEAEVATMLRALAEAHGLSVSAVLSELVRSAYFARFGDVGLREEGPR